MKKLSIEWKNVEVDGLPEPNSDKEYFVLYCSGCGYGTYDYEFGESVYHPEPLFEGGKSGWYESIRLKTCRWFLDFDGSGHENEISDYFEIIYPENL